MPIKCLSQKALTSRVHKEDIASLKATLEHHRLMCSATSTAKHFVSGFGMSIPAVICTHLDNDSVMIDISLWPILQMCCQHRCHCSTITDELGQHLLLSQCSNGSFLLK